VGKRSEERAKRRLACELEGGGRRSKGIILNLSESGIYVQSSFIPPDEEVVVQISDPDLGGEIVVRARPVRRKAVPANLAAVRSPGFALRVLSASPGYSALVSSFSESLGGEEAAEEARPPAPDLPRFRVRVSRLGTSRTKLLTRPGESVEEVERSVLEEMGAGWSVVEVREL
jgi:hypothetical protein